MGTCLSHLSSKGKNQRSHCLQRSFYQRDKEKVEFQFLVDSGDINENVEVRKPHPTNKKKRFYHRSSGANSQGALPLDLRRISRPGPHPWRKFSFSSSTPPSSVDLEWENEGCVGNSMSHRRLMTSTTTMEDASNESGTGNGGSPVDSLEWDSCEDKGGAAIDPDTEQLLQEIERLTAKALKETGGEWTGR